MPQRLQMMFFIIVRKDKPSVAAERVQWQATVAHCRRKTVPHVPWVRRIVSKLIIKCFTKETAFSAASCCQIKMPDLWTALRIFRGESAIFFTTKRRIGWGVCKPKKTRRRNIIQLITVGRDRWGSGLRHDGVPSCFLLVLDPPQSDRK